MNAFNRSGIKLYAVASNLETGKAEYLQCINMLHDVIYVRASASLPLLSRIVEVDGKKLLDGGACDSIPVKQFQKMGYQKNIVVLTQCKDYRKGKKQPSSSHPSQLSPNIQSLLKHWQIVISTIIAR